MNISLFFTKRNVFASDFSLSHLLFLMAVTMVHRFLSCLVVSLSLICAVSCLPVSTSFNLVDLFYNATGTVKTDIELIADLDFSMTIITLPLGASSDGTCAAFSGVFQDNGHSIKGLKLKYTKQSGFDGSGLFLHGGECHC